MLYNRTIYSLFIFHRTFTFERDGATSIFPFFSLYLVQKKYFGRPFPCFFLDQISSVAHHLEEESFFERFRHP